MRLRLDSTKWLPVRALATNNRGVSGTYQANNQTVADFASNEFLGFQRVPDAMVMPMRKNCYVLVGDQSEVTGVNTVHLAAESVHGGITFWNDTPMQVNVFTGVGYAGFALIHEWGHAVDGQYAKPLSGLGRSVQSDVVALWNRADGIRQNLGLANSYYYGWFNKDEFFAELFRMHWSGTAGGLPVASVSADGDFRNLLSGPGSDVLPDDSYATAAHGIISSLAPPVWPS
jgi:hypothetical protein